MSGATAPTFVLAGASGRPPDCALFAADPSDRARFVFIPYPTWPTYVEGGFTGGTLIELLAAQMIGKAPSGPIQMLGVSIGGHFAYALALHLQSLGRDVAGLCVIDSGHITSADRSAGWKQRILSHSADLLQRRRGGEFLSYIRRLTWRGMFRIVGDRLPEFVRTYASPTRLRWIGALDPDFEEELTMRLLLLKTASWIGGLDRCPRPLHAPTVLLRTGENRSGDATWRIRCPGIRIVEIAGNHETLFEAENAARLRAAFVSATCE
jgi:thioesterase domain-containing protein